MTKKEHKYALIIATLQGSILGILSGMDGYMDGKLLETYIKRIKHAVTESENQLDKLIQNKQ